MKSAKLRAAEAADLESAEDAAEVPQPAEGGVKQNSRARIACRQIGWARQARKTGSGTSIETAYYVK